MIMSFKLVLAIFAVLSALLWVYTMITKKNAEEIIFSMLLHTICLMHYYFY